MLFLSVAVMENLAIVIKIGGNRYDPSNLDVLEKKFKLDLNASISLT